MSSLFAGLAFTTPLALLGLLALPLIWWLLRFNPPHPQQVRFPPYRLLLELISKEEQPQHTPVVAAVAAHGTGRGNHFCRCRPAAQRVIGARPLG
jgi:hypothetical protein